MVSPGAGEDDVEAAVAGTAQGEALAGGLEPGDEARDVAAAEEGLAGQGEEEEKGGALLVGMLPDMVETVKAHGTSRVCLWLVSRIRTYVPILLYHRFGRDVHFYG